MTYTRIEVKPSAGACGAEIHGVDLSQDLDNETFAEIHKAFLEHQVIFFRDQELTPDQHKAFGKRFGDLNIHPHYEPLEGHPEIMPVIKEAEDVNNIGDTWHSDVSFLERPPLGSILYGLELPPVGGDTMFASQYSAHDGLSEGLRETLGKMKAVHSSRILSDPETAKKRNESRSTRLREDTQLGEDIETLHPVVRTHPETGRKALFVNLPFTIGFEDMTEEESAPLLKYLFTESAKPEYTCRFRWEPGSIAFWDNRCVLHYALNDYHGHRRCMHRVTVNGDRPF
jgi:taurine dioxygenase